MCVQALHDIAVFHIDSTMKCAPFADLFSDYG